MLQRLFHKLAHSGASPGFAHVAPGLTFKRLPYLRPLSELRRGGRRYLSLPFHICQRASGGLPSIATWSLSASLFHPNSSLMRLRSAQSSYRIQPNAYLSTVDVSSRPKTISGDAKGAGVKIPLGVRDGRTRLQSG